MTTKGSVTRAFGLSLLVGGAAAGVWMWQVRPLRITLATLRQTNNELERELTTSASPEAESKLAELRRLQAGAEAIAAKSPRASDLYERYRQAAAKAGVRLTRIDPTSIKASSSLESRSGFALEASGYDIQVDGSYAGVIDFVEAVETTFGLARITSLRIAPEVDKATGKTQITASIQAIHTAILGKKMAAAEGIK